MATHETKRDTTKSPTGSTKRRRGRATPAVESGRAYDAAADEPREDTLEPLADYDLEKMPRGV